MKIALNLKKQLDHSYKIFIEEKIDFAKELKKLKLGEKYAIITDSVVKNLYAKKLASELKKAGIESEIFSFQKGEKSKALKTIETLAEQMVTKGFNKKDAIIALGGGVVGDTAGFLASIYMRGIPYVQIPTNLLAMVDSSIGGKTGVDLKCGKNLIGTITQPKIIFMNLSYLKTLPEKQIRNGLGEIIKYGVIKDKKLFEYIEKNLSKIINKDPQALKRIITDSAKIKVKVVEQDEKENGLRMILNYGHTFGHAIEKLSNYKLLHGYAISIGMVIANNIALEKGFLKEKDAKRIHALFKAAQLPTTTLTRPTKTDIASDKKRQGNYINLILPTEIGKVIIHKEKWF